MHLEVYVNCAAVRLGGLAPLAIKMHIKICSSEVQHHLFLRL